VVLVLGGSSVVLVRLVVLDCAGYSDDAGAGWACLAMPRWRGGSGAGAGRNLSSADAVMWRVMELSGSSLIDAGAAVTRS